ALAAGQTLTDVFNYTASDGTATASTTLTITITGTNDAPTANPDSNSVVEDTAPNPVSGNVLTNDTDADAGTSLTVSAVNGAAGNVGATLVGTYGSVVVNGNGTYSYTLNNALPAVQALAAGQTLTDVF